MKLSKESYHYRFNSWFEKRFKLGYIPEKNVLEYFVSTFFRGLFLPLFYFIELIFHPFGSGKRRGFLNWFIVKRLYSLNIDRMITYSRRYRIKLEEGGIDIENVYFKLRVFIEIFTILLVFFGVTSAICFYIVTVGFETVVYGIFKLLISALAIVVLAFVLMFTSNLLSLLNKKISKVEFSD